MTPVKTTFFALAISALMTFGSPDLVRAEAELPASDLNVARYWYALSSETPDYEALAKSTNSYTRANQFDQPEIYKTLLEQTRTAFSTGFTGSELLAVNLQADLAQYDFERSGFALSAFNGQTFIPTTSPILNLGRDRVRLDNQSYRIVFTNPEPFAFMDLPPDEARTLLNGRRGIRAGLQITLQPVGAQVDQVNSGYSTKTMRTVMARIVEARVVSGDMVVWEKSVGTMDASAVAEAAASAGQVVDVTEQTVETVWHRLLGTKPDFILAASKTSAFRSANRFDQDAVLDEEVAKAEQRFDALIPNAERFGGRIRTQLSEYDANREGFHVSLFSGGGFIEGGLFFENAEDFAFVPMAPGDAQAFLGKHGRFPSAVIDFEAQPVLPQSHLTSLADLTPEPRIQSYLTKVVITADNKGQQTTLVEEERAPLGRQDIQRLAAEAPSIDTAPVYDRADIVLTWAKATNQSPDFEAWAKAASDYRYAENEFVRQRLFPVLRQEREDFYKSYPVQPWRVRIAAQLSEYDFSNQRFELQRIAFDRTLSYSDGLTEDIFGTAGRKRPYEVKLTNLEALRYFAIPKAQAEEILTQMGSGRSVTLDMLVYPTRAVHNAPWGEDETRLVEALITDVRLLGQSNRYGGGKVSRLYDVSLTQPPAASVVAEVNVDAKPHVDPLTADVKTMRLGMTRAAFEKTAKQTFGKVEPYRGQANVLRFENADGEAGYGHFDEAGKLAFLQYYRTLPGRGKTAAVEASVIEKYGTPFFRENKSIGSKITYSYLYFSDPAALGLDPKEPKVGLWVEIQESDQLRPITQLEINLGTKPE